MACAWLLVVGCFDPPTGPPYKIHLLSADPPVVSVHGGDWVTVGYEGELPFNVGIAVDGVTALPVSVDLANHTLTLSAPVHDIGTVGISLFDNDRGRAIASKDDLLTYQVMPPKAAWNVSSYTQSSLSWPLHPELSHPCARGGELYLENLGDELLELTDLRSSNTEFSLEPPPPRRALEYGEYYVVGLCFTSSTSGFPSAALTATTNAGDVTVNVSTNVRPLLAGLDPTFHGGGLAFNVGQDAFPAAAVVGSGGDGILTWVGMRLIAIDSTGTESHYDIPTTLIGSVVANSIIAVRTAPGGGGYALVVNSSQHNYGTIIRFDDALVPNAQFDLPNDGANLYVDLQVAPNGRLLAIGTDVVAMANGTVDTTYGNNGRVMLAQFVNPSLRPRSMIDSQGRLYAYVSGALKRLTAAGAVDLSFSATQLNSMVDAMTIDAADHVYILSGSRVLQLSETGDTTIVVTNGPFGYDLAVDGTGRAYITSGAGLVNRYANNVASADLGYGNASSVICPPSGGCYILGVDILTQVPFTTTPDYMDKYVLRLAD
jgi:hypothetical protein